MMMSGRIILVVTLVTIVSSSTAHVLSPVSPTTSKLSSTGFCNGGNRTDCGYMGINQAICESRGCCWQPTQNGNPENLPWCFFKSPPSPSCSTTPVCSGHGSCTSNGQCTCSKGYATCGPVSSHDCSVSLSNDVKNCGACGHSCPSGPGVLHSSCSAGTCQTACATGYSLCFGMCAKGANCSVAAPFSSSEMKTMQGFMEQALNIQGSGGVVAAPQTSDPDYYYHWQRDGAISMREYMNMTTLATAQPDMETYVSWVHKAQFAPDPNGIDVRGEPKFFLGHGGPLGSVYNKGWLRPQNDGCALRSITLMTFAQRLLAAGQRDYVAANIWTGSDSVPGVQRDLQYVLQVWMENSGDPWEEVTGQVFFDKFAQRLALIMGAELATEFGDTAAAQLYNSTAQEIEKNIIQVHWNEQKGIIMEVPNIRELDSATHLGIIYGYAQDGFLGPDSEKVQSSVAVLVDSFKSYSDFTINAKDDAAGIPGLLVGRYLYDHYNGGNPEQPSGGNPWVLCTAGLANVYYLAASAHATTGTITFTDTNARFFEQVLDMAEATRAYHRRASGTSATLDVAMADAEARAALAMRGTLLATKESTKRAFAHVLGAAVLSGDGIMLRLRHHVQPNGFHLPEELNKDTGVSQGAKDLTWSYGTLFGAMHSRKGAVQDHLPASVGVEAAAHALSV